MKHFEKGMTEGKKDMFDIYLESVPHYLNSMALGFGEVFYLESYLRRINHCSCAKTRAVFEKLGLLFALTNIIEKQGEFR